METKKEMIAVSLRMRANYIETGDPTLSRNDALEINEHAEKKVIIKKLDDNQQELVLNLRKTADKIEFNVREH